MVACEPSYFCIRKKRQSFQAICFSAAVSDAGECRSDDSLNGGADVTVEIHQSFHLRYGDPADALIVGRIVDSRCFQRFFARCGEKAGGAVEGVIVLDKRITSHDGRMRQQRHSDAGFFQCLAHCSIGGCLT